MGAHRLDELVPDPVERVQRGERVLEDHRYVVTPDRAQLVFGQGHEITPVEHDLPRDDRALPAGQPQGRQRRDGLAGTRLADYAQCPALVHLVADAVHGMDHPVFAGEIHLEVFDAQKRLAGAHE